MLLSVVRLAGGLPNVQPTAPSGSGSIITGVDWVEFLCLIAVVGLFILELIHVKNNKWEDVIDATFWACLAGVSVAATVGAVVAVTGLVR